MFGENPDPKDLLFSGVEQAEYFMFTVLVNIVLFNLLIAVISNTYDSVQSSMEAHHLRTKAGILHEISSI